MVCRYLMGVKHAKEGDRAGQAQKACMVLVALYSNMRVWMHL
jgi:hypothetical protein